MGKVYQLLLIDDNEEDAKQIKLELAKLDLDIELEVILNEKQLIAQLKNAPPDLVICDYNLQSFSGIKALEVVKEFDLHRPFMLVSESIGAEKAVDAMLEGASDYILKQNLDRLGPAVRRELSSYKSKEIGKELEAYQISDIGHWELDLVNDELFWSETIKKLHEVTTDFKPNLENALNFYEEGYHREKIKEKVEKAIETGESFDVELKIITEKGNERWTRAVGETEFRDGKCAKIYGSTQDITDRKRTEIQLKLTEQKLREIVENSTNMFYRHNTNHELTYVSPQAKDFLGSPPDEAKKKWMKFVTDHPINKKGYERTQEAIKTGESQPAFNLELQKESGERIWVRVNEAPIIEDGQTVAIVGSLTDITEQKKVEEEVKEKNRKLKNAQEIARLGYWEFNAQTEEIFFSDEIYEIFGLNPEDTVTLKTIIDRIYPEDRDYVVTQNEKAIENNTTLNIEHRILLPDGAVKWLHVISNRNNAENDTNTVEGTIQDVTEKKELELLLNQTNRLAKVGSWKLELSEGNEEELYWSEMTRELFEVGDAYQPTLTDAFEFHESESKQKIQRAVKKAISEGIPFDEELLITTAKGSKRWIRSIGKPEFVEGQCIRLFGSIQDIHDRKSVQLKVQKANEERKQILDRINDAFFAVDDNWVVTFWNKRAEEVLGMPSKDIVNNNLWEVYEDAVELDFYTQYHKAVEKQVTVHFEEYYPGAEKWFEVSAYPSESGLSVYFRDITERKESNEKLKELNSELKKRAEELAESNAELEQFAYVASHDLQEPLRMVSSFLNRLEKKYSDELDEKAHQYIDFAVDGAQRMRQIILDLLNYSRVGQKELSRESLCLDELLEDILKLERAGITETEATVTWKNLPAIEADKAPIKQVFQNLINNAIKYRRPDVAPKIQIQGEEKDQYWKFSVIDNGIGIKKEYHENIFAIFRRLHTQEEYTGTGIGLAVTKKIVEKHGGQIWVESDGGPGSIFRFTISK